MTFCRACLMRGASMWRPGTTRWTCGSTWSGPAPPRTSSRSSWWWCRSGSPATSRMRNTTGAVLAQGGASRRSITAQVRTGDVNHIFFDLMINVHRTKVKQIHYQTQLMVLMYVKDNFSCISTFWLRQGAQGVTLSVCPAPSALKH